jgi:hypothetical protein
VHIRVAAAVLAATLLTSLAACSGGGLFGKQYEYEEDLTLDIDGSATLVVNASLPALAALRGLPVPEDPSARPDADQIRALFESPVSEVTRVSRSWRRNGRRFIQVRVSIDDINRLGEAAPFAWSQYAFGPKDGRHVFRQVVGKSAFTPGTLKNVGWSGRELVAFRLHLPSKIIFHNARDIDTNQTSTASRGNILAWEQHLSDRLEGQPVEIHVEMESQSILNRTLWLFGGAFAAAVLVLIGLVWWTMQRGKDQDETVAG